jgi:VIT1/CCC1 family predicted Fe2+/Mn2+ transporter
MSTLGSVVEVVTPSSSPLEFGVPHDERRRDEITVLRYDPRVIQAADHERHGAGTSTIRDLVLGMADGLTVPFALAAGVTGVVAASGIVVTAGLAEIVAGAISMGLGGYLAARSEVAHYAKEYAREIRETEEIPNEEKAEVAQILHGYGVREPILSRVVNEITSDREQWVAFMMRNELGLERPDEHAAPRSAALVGGGYVLGGIFPLAPYVFIPNAHDALYWSILCTSIALLVFGAVRARVLATPIFLGSLQTWMIGAIAASAAYGLARLVSRGGL